MQRKWHWPLVTVILSSFLLGTIWGVKMIRDRAEKEGRLEADSVLNLLAPNGFLPKEMLLEFQRRERIQVILHEELFPSALLRRALKASPGQFDVAIVFHHQVSALRNERRMLSLYDSRVKFPTNIAPDFRKLPDDRNLMDTAPLQWGLMGIVGKQRDETSSPKISAERLGFWPAIMIGGEVSDVTAQSFVAGLQPSIEDLSPKKAGLTYFLSSDASEVERATHAPSAIAISHGSLAFPPLKELNLELRPIRPSNSTDLKNESYMLWILTAVAMADGDLERSRKLIRFFLDPVQNLKLVQHTKAGATTLRYQEGFGRLPDSLQSSYFRRFPLDKIRIERDERVRQVDDLLEQTILGAAIQVKEVSKPTPHPIEPVKVAKPIIPPPAVVTQPPVIKPEPPMASEAKVEESNEVDVDTQSAPITEPSEEPLPAD
jgi:hypothetical protein